MAHAVRRPGEQVLVEQTAVLFARRTGPARKRHAYDVRAAWRLKQGRIPLTRLDIAFLFSLFVIFVLNVADITITLIHIANAGWEAEGNPLIRTIAEQASPAIVVAFKLGIIIGSMWLLWFLYRQTVVAMSTARDDVGRRKANFVFRTQIGATLFLMGLYTWIIQNNLRITWL